MATRKPTTKKATAPKEAAVSDQYVIDAATGVNPAKGAGCSPSHKEQRAAMGAGHLVCKECGKEVPKSFGIVIDGQKVEACPEDHEAMRARIGAGHLVCPTCKQQVPNEF